MRKLLPIVIGLVMIQLALGFEISDLEPYVMIYHTIDHDTNATIWDNSTPTYEAIADNHGGSEFREGYKNDSYWFDGATYTTADGMLSNMDDQAEFTDSFCVSAWIRPEGKGAQSWEVIISKGASEGDGWGLWCEANNNYCRVYIFNGAKEARMNEFTEGEWGHVVATYDDPNNELRIYRNGTLSNTTTSVTSDPSYTSAGLEALQIGASTYGASPDLTDQWKGNLDEIMLFNITCNDSVAETLWANGTTLFEVPPPDITPPSILGSTTYNLTSDGGCTDWRTNTTKPCNTTDSTPTITFDTDESANCRIGVADENYTTMGASRDCGTTGGTSHTCTIIAGDALSSGESDIYVGCEDLSNNENVSSTSGALRVNLDDTCTAPASADWFIQDDGCRITIADLFAHTRTGYKVIMEKPVTII